MQTHASSLTICILGLENQRLISHCLDAGMLSEAKRLQYFDSQLRLLRMQHKTLGRSGYYIWHTQDDGKVRPAHAANDEGVFAWDYPTCNRPSG